MARRRSTRVSALLKPSKTCGMRAQSRFRPIRGASSGGHYITIMSHLGVGNTSDAARRIPNPA